MHMLAAISRPHCPPLLSHHPPSQVRDAQEPVWMTSPMFPRYYQATFHYQTDGWASSKWVGW